jgi:hypothetical protein
MFFHFRHGNKNDSPGPGPGQYNVTGLSAKGRIDDHMYSSFAVINVFLKEFYLIQFCCHFLMHGNIKCLCVASKGKVVLQYICYGGIRGRMRYSSYSFLFWTLEGGEWSSSFPSHTFPSGKGPSITHVTGGWVGLRANLDADVRGKILCLSWGLNPSRPVTQYTD